MDEINHLDIYSHDTIHFKDVNPKFAAVEMFRFVARGVVWRGLWDSNQIAIAHVSQWRTFTLRAAVQLCPEEWYCHSGMRMPTCRQTPRYFVVYLLALVFDWLLNSRQSWMIYAVPSSTCWILLQRWLLSSTSWTLPCPHICCLFTDWSIWGKPAWDLFIYFLYNSSPVCTRQIRLTTLTSIYI